MKEEEEVGSSQLLEPHPLAQTAAYSFLSLKSTVNLFLIILFCKSINNMLVNGGLWTCQLYYHFEWAWTENAGPIAIFFRMS